MLIFIDIVIITYKNCNIDLLKNNQIINISDIKRKEITGIKSINNITISESIVYLSTSIGLILVDLENEEIKDTYNVGDTISMYEIKELMEKVNDVLEEENKKKSNDQIQDI